MKLAASIPPMTVIPMTRREMAPAPLARPEAHSQDEAKDVIRIGRRRSFAPSGRLDYGLPLSYSILANSTIRIAFFAASPMSMTSPIWA